MPIIHIFPASTRSLIDFGIKSTNGDWNMDELFRYFEIGIFQEQVNLIVELVVPCQSSDMPFYK